jgi:hypothetical protein
VLGFPSWAMASVTPGPLSEDWLEKDPQKASLRRLRFLLGKNLFVFFGVFSQLLQRRKYRDLGNSLRVYNVNNVNID